MDYKEALRHLENGEIKSCIDYFKNNHYELEYGYSLMLSNKLNDAKERGICQPKPRLDFLPGFKCENNTDCLSNNCFNHTVCQGLPVGAQCSSHQYCDVGLFCNSGNKCQLQKDLNSPCFHDVECVNNAGCYKGFCTQYLSLPKGEEIVDYSN